MRGVAGSKSILWILAISRGCMVSWGLSLSPSHSSIHPSLAIPSHRPFSPSPPIQLSIPPLPRLPLHPSIHPSTHPPFCSPTHPSTHHQSIKSFQQSIQDNPLINSFIHPIHPPLLTHPSTYESINPHPPLHPHQHPHPSTPTLPIHILYTLLLIYLVIHLCHIHCFVFKIYSLPSQFWVFIIFSFLALLSLIVFYNKFFSYLQLKPYLYSGPLKHYMGHSY